MAAIGASRVGMAVIAFSRFGRRAGRARLPRLGMFGGRWRPGHRPPLAGSSDLLISESPRLATSPTALKVTLRPPGISTTPTGPPVIVWPARESVGTDALVCESHEA